MTHSKKIWGLLTFVLILLAYILPYTLLTNIGAWYGSFLVWGIIAAFIIALNIVITKDWGK